MLGFTGSDSLSPDWKSWLIYYQVSTVSELLQPSTKWKRKRKKSTCPSQFSLRCKMTSPWSTKQPPLSYFQTHNHWYPAQWFDLLNSFWFYYHQKRTHIYIKLQSFQTKISDKYPPVAYEPGQMMPLFSLFYEWWF